ncbi:MAG TPA: DUF2946 family protein [Stellaceae bacterium]|nr:DUF2946 family protein [Stellaceae bacterium]
MRLSRPKWSRWAAAWLGIAALCLGALVPIHLAFDLAAALEPASQATIRHGVEWRLLALVSLHDAHGDDHPAQNGDQHHGKQHSPACPVCSSLATLGAFALPGAAAVLLPPAIAPSHAPPAVAAPPESTAAAYYRARAPPLT